MAGERTWSTVDIALAVAALGCVWFGFVAWPGAPPERHAKQVLSTPAPAPVRPAPPAVEQAEPEPAAPLPWVAPPEAAPPEGLAPSEGPPPVDSDLPWREWHTRIVDHLVARRWREAESLARRALTYVRDEPEAWSTLGYTLMRQDRDAEAAEAFRRSLALREVPATRELLERVERQTGVDRSKSRQESSRFALRYEGDVDASIGRSVLTVLDRSYDELRRTLDCEPAGQIPVLLYPLRDFVAAGSGPVWAQGTFDHFDGRIRVRTGNLAGGIDTGLERTLTHELVHAFLAERTRGSLPRELNEGLAQYLSGVRADPMTGDWARGAITGGEIYDFYAAALGFVQYLVERHRMGTMNLMLETLGRIGNVDKAFQRAYGMRYQDAREEWITSLR